MFSKFFKHQPVAANTEEKVHLNVQSDLESSENNMVLRTEDLVKKYRQRTVVNHVSIDVTQGEIVGLLGPNGAGKTTTFYMTTGLITPNQGHIYLNDLDITDYPVYKRAQIGIGYLAQEASVFRKLSVEDNIRCVLEMTHTTKEYQRDKLESLIAEFRLQKVRKNLGDQLSGGERRRTEIARCLAISPKFIMLDEPFAGVDPIAVEDIQSIVYKLKEKNIGILKKTLEIYGRKSPVFENKILSEKVKCGFELLKANPMSGFSELIGLGAGLTPSCDDIISGISAYFYLNGIGERFNALLAKYLYENGDTVTTAVSKNLLTDVAKGYRNGSLYNLICAVANDEKSIEKCAVANDEKSIEKCALDMIDYGSTSGTETCYGVILGYLLSSKKELKEWL